MISGTCTYAKCVSLCLLLGCAVTLTACRDHTEGLESQTRLPISSNEIEAVNREQPLEEGLEVPDTVKGRYEHTINNQVVVNGEKWVVTGLVRTGNDLPAELVGLVAFPGMKNGDPPLNIRVIETLHENVVIEIGNDNKKQFPEGTFLVIDREGRVLKTVKGVKVESLYDNLDVELNQLVIQLLREMDGN